MERHHTLETPTVALPVGAVPRHGKPSGLHHAVAAALVPLVALVALLILFLAGCGDQGAVSTTAAPQTTVYMQGASTTYADEAENGSAVQEDVAAPGYGGQTGVVVSSLPAGEHRVISNASLQIEVEEGKFQAVFDQASLLADKYGGYILSANSRATGAESIIRSGVVAIRLPSQSLALALNDATALGKVTAQQLDSQDVTEEYVDLQARLKNAQAQEEAILLLLQRAETVEDALRVRETLMSIQQEIEQYRGRIAYLDEHTAFATLTMSIYEQGGLVVTGGGWGFVDALREAARALVRTVNELIVFLGGALPVLAVLALIGWVAYMIVRAVMRRQGRERAAAYAAQTQAQAQAAYRAQSYQPAPAETGPAPAAAGAPGATSETGREAGTGAQEEQRS